MRRTSLLILVIAVLVSCNNTEKKAVSGFLIRKEVTDIAIKYVSSKFKEAKTTVGKDGAVTVEENQKSFIVPPEKQISYSIDPQAILTGNINNDNYEDAIITIAPSTGQYLEIPEILIIINNDGKLALSRVIESDMKILSIKDKIITAEISTRSRNSPLRDCNVCKEVVKYRFEAGDLIQIK